MKCPHCKKEIELKHLTPEELKTLRAKVSGMLSKRVITAEQQAKMQAARRKG